MARRLVYAPEAEAQLLLLYRYIAAAASPQVARNYTDRIVQRCEKLVDFPHQGSPRDDLRPGLRTIAFQRRVVIAYSVLEEVVAVLGIFYGGQDIDTILSDD
jgi:toxin ParE1/3/4